MFHDPSNMDIHFLASVLDAFGDDPHLFPFVDESLFLLWPFSFLCFIKVNAVVSMDS